MLQEIVEMQLLEDQQAARFVAAWLEIRMLELGTVKICEDACSVQMFHAMVLQRVAMAEESRGSVKALFLDYDGTLREFEASELKTCKTQKL